MGMYRENFNVRYSEVDQNKEITPISVMQYFQEIGCLHSKYVDFGAKNGYAWLIIQWKVKIISKVTWNDTIMVRTWASEIKGPYCFRDYEMYCGEKLIAIGTSKWVLTNFETHKIERATENIIQLYQPENRKVFEEPLVKIEPGIKYDRTMTHIIDEHDLDANRHMNNIKYIELAYRMIHGDVKEIEVLYKHEAVLGEEITCYYDNGKITMKSGENLIAIVCFK